MNDITTTDNPLFKPKLSKTQCGIMNYIIFLYNTHNTEFTLLEIEDFVKKHNLYPSNNPYFNSKRKVLRTLKTIENHLENTKYAFELLRMHPPIIYKFKTVSEETHKMHLCLQ